jgi:hypothetical protein
MAATAKQPVALPALHEGGSDPAAPVPGAQSQNGRLGLEKRFALFECNPVQRRALFLRGQNLEFAQRFQNLQIGV